MLFICGHAPIRRRPHLESNGQQFICSKSLVLSTTMPPPQYEHPYGTYQIYLKRFLSGGMPHHCTLYSQTSVQTIQQGAGGQHNRWYFAGNPAALPIGVPPADAIIRCARQWIVGRSLDRSRRRGMDGDRRRYTTLTAAGMV